MEGRLTIDPENLEQLSARLEDWERAGATHLTLNTMRLGLDGVEGHLEALAAAARLCNLR